VACLLLPAFVEMAAAGVLLVETGIDFRAGAAIRRELRIGAGRVSIEIEDARSHQTIVYQTSPKQVWMIDHKQKFYREFDAATLRMLKQQVRAVQDLVDDQGQGAADSKLRFEKVWEGETVSAWTCDKYEGRMSGVKGWDVCAAGWNQFKARATDFDLLREAISTLQDLRLRPEDSLLPSGTPGKASTDAFEGVPVQRLRQENDRTVELLELREMEMYEFTDSDFSPPSDYLGRPVILMQAEPEEGRKGGTRSKGTP